MFDAVPLYDKAAQRFLLVATCGGKGAVLLAASATPDPTGTFFLFTLMADGAGTGMVCDSPVETAVADSARLSYDANGIVVSLRVPGLPGRRPFCRAPARTNAYPCKIHPPACLQPEPCTRCCCSFNWCPSNPEHRGASTLLALLKRKVYQRPTLCMPSSAPFFNRGGAG